MERTAINPTAWGLGFSMNQGEVVEGATRTLRCSGQVALEEDPAAPLGVSVVAAGDMRAQIASALASIDALLAGAGMQRSHVVFLHFYTTDVDAFLEHYDVYAEWIGAAGVRPPQTLLGVARLALPELLVEIEATAAA